MIFLIGTISWGWGLRCPFFAALKTVGVLRHGRLRQGFVRASARNRPWNLADCTTRYFAPQRSVNGRGNLIVLNAFLFVQNRTVNLAKPTWRLRLGLWAVTSRCPYEGIQKNHRPVKIERCSLRERWAIRESPLRNGAKSEDYAMIDVPGASSDAPTKWCQN